MLQGGVGGPAYFVQRPIPIRHHESFGDITMGVYAAVYSDLKYPFPQPDDDTIRNGLIWFDDNSPQADGLLPGWYDARCDMEVRISDHGRCLMSTFLHDMCLIMVGVPADTLWNSSPWLHGWPKPNEDDILAVVHSAADYCRLPTYKVDFPRPYASREFEELLYHMESSQIIGTRTCGRVREILLAYKDRGSEVPHFDELFTLFDTAGTKSGIIWIG